MPNGAASSSSWGERKSAHLYNSIALEPSDETKADRNKVKRGKQAKRLQDEALEALIHVHIFMFTVKLYVNVNCEHFWHAHCENTIPGHTLITASR